LSKSHADLLSGLLEHLSHSDCTATSAPQPRTGSKGVNELHSPKPKLSRSIIFEAHLIVTRHASLVSVCLVSGRISGFAPERLRINFYPLFHPHTQHYKHYIWPRRCYYIVSTIATPTVPLIALALTVIYPHCRPVPRRTGAFSLAFACISPNLGGFIELWEPPQVA